MRLRRYVAVAASAALAAGFLVAAPAATAQEKPRPVVSGWFGWWASDTAINQMATTADGVVGEIAMFWWSFQGEKNPLCLYDNGDYDKDGAWGDALCSSATPWTTPKFDRQRKALQAAGIKVNASITDLGSASKGKLSAYLDSGKNRRAYAKLITEYAVKAGVDGIDLDWEVFAFHDGRDSWPSTKPRWVAMIKELSKQLKAAGLTLWATVPGGVPPFINSGSPAVDACGDPRGPIGSPTPGTGYCVYAWKEIAPYVDRLNIMAYDYSWSVAGPIGPNDWAALVARSAVEQIGAEYADRVWIGAPQYGRNWPLPAGSGWTVNSECPAGWKPKETPARTSVTPSSARELAARTKADITWDAKFGEWTFEYWWPTDGKVNKKDQQCDIKRRVWFADTRSAIERARIVPDLRIGGIAVWDFGTVTSDFYPRLAEYGRQIAPAATSVTLKAPKTAVHGRTISVKVATDSRGGAAKGAEATLYFEPEGGATTRSRVDTMTLDADGKGVFRVPVQASGTWSVEVDGSWSRAPGRGEAKTSVRYSVSAQADQGKVSAGTTVTLTGTVSPGDAGIPVTVQRRSGKGAWRDIASTTTGAAGAVTVTVKPTVPGEFGYRLRVPASDGLAQGTSARIVITVE